MNAPVTRRALLGASTIAIGAVALPAAALAFATAMPAARPDAALLDLIGQHAAAVEAMRPLNEACAPLLERFEALAPERPNVLLQTFSDRLHDLGGCHGREIGPSGKRRDFFDHSDIERLRNAMPVKLRYSADGEVPTVRVPDVTGETRRREVVQAHDAWLAERVALADRLGLTAANAASDGAFHAIGEIENAIMDTVPVTLNGFRAKARWIAATPQPEEWAEALLRDLCGTEAAA